MQVYKKAFFFIKNIYATIFNHSHKKWKDSLETQAE